MVRFGPAGNSSLFYDEGFKSSLEIPKFLKEKGLTAYEYQCGRGVRVKEDFCLQLKEASEENDILLSIHSPYFINLASEDKEKLEKSFNHIEKSLWAAEKMGAKVIVVHPGSIIKGKPRTESLDRAKSFLEEVLDKTKNYKDIKIGLETMGKVNQLGSLDEVLSLCLLSNRLKPVIDFGHLHARDGGLFNKKEEFIRVLEKIGEVLGEERLRDIHIHFSPIEYTQGGEKKHRTFDEREFGPRFEDFAPLIFKYNLSSVIISESQDKQTEDAILMKDIYNSLKGGV
ncbi:TIM barrel protein [Anaerobranca gottschalkii]|uniref:Deoxyribonuclease-4 n=1 Tax=Anaerobranca gottschalkii DSM 13577 TaxID=1120990 RepID=A0A1I0AYV4_9FIRM|nr:TIM barrel protein [Anaerobranca gottschalkii]SES99636.1 deoxyribonuclease-4 [Anaerobranca gottschalkii DSM 13577]